MTLLVGLGLRAQRGGSVLVAVTLEGQQPRVLLSSFLATALAGDRLAFEPYHVAVEMERGVDGGALTQAEAAVAEGRARQDALAAAGLAEVVRTLRSEGAERVVAALLVNRAGWMTDLLSYSLAFADHPPVAEGLAVRDAIRFACARTHLELVELDEKSLAERATKTIGLDPAETEARLKTLGATVGKPWRKEQRLACLAAWTALAECGDERRAGLDSRPPAF